MKIGKLNELKYIKKKGEDMESKIINGKEYRLVAIRNRTKWVSKDGDLINPHRPNQK